MGEWFTFVCDDCAYEAEVSGGPDAGMLVTVETMSCSDCHSAGSLEGDLQADDRAQQLLPHLIPTVASMGAARPGFWRRPAAHRQAGRVRMCRLGDDEPPTERGSRRYCR